MSEVSNSSFMKFHGATTAGYSKSTKSPLNATAESSVDRRVDLFQARARAGDVVEETLRRILNAVA